MANLFTRHTSAFLSVLLMTLSACDSSQISTPGLKSAVVASPNVLEFGNFDTTQMLNLRSSRGEFLTWKVQSTSIYVDVSPDSGFVASQPITITVKVHRTTRNTGSSTHNVTVTDIQNDKKSIIQVKFNNLAPELVLSHSSLDFGQQTDTLSLELTNAGSHSLIWSVTNDFPWCTVNPDHGILQSESEKIVVSLNRDSLPPGNLSKIITFHHAQNSKELNLMFLEGERIMHFDFESEAKFHEFWNVWDQDSSEPYGLDTWGIVRDAERGGSVLWSNGQGLISTGIPGHDGGINANLELKANKRLDLSRYEMVTYKLLLLREFQWQDELLRLYFSGFDGGALVSFSSSSNGWEPFDYTLSNDSRFASSMEIKINYLTPEPVAGLAGAKIDNLEVWAK